MKPEIKKQFVERLRKAQKPAHPGILKIGDRYCPEGLLCQMYLECHLGSGEWQHHPSRSGEVFWLNGYPHLFTPPEVEEWAGIVTDRINLPDEFIFNERLTYLNDCTSLALDEIANIIEEQW